VGKYNFAVMKNTQPMKYDIFISYSRRDLDEVTALVEMLKARIPAIEIWMDLDGIEAADEFDEKIITAIDASSYVLFMVSNNSNSVGEGSSKWTKKELVYAKNTGKRIIPILLPGAELSSWFLFEFGRVDCIDITSDVQVEKLLANLANWTGKELIPPPSQDPTHLSPQEQAILDDIQRKKDYIQKVEKVVKIILYILIPLVMLFFWKVITH
jgi:hypothetical protein